jgi:hypothetical protein
MLMRQTAVRAPGARRPGDRRRRPARPRPAHAQPAVAATCGHARYTKGCDACALVGIYADHLNRTGLTPAGRAEVEALFQAGDKAGLFKLWQAAETPVPLRPC